MSINKGTMESERKMQENFLKALEHRFFENVNKYNLSPHIILDHLILYYHHNKLDKKLIDIDKKVYSKYRLSKRKIDIWCFFSYVEYLMHKHYFQECDHELLFVLLDKFYGYIHLRQTQGFIEVIKKRYCEIFNTIGNILLQSTLLPQLEQKYKHHIITPMIKYCSYYHLEFNIEIMK